MINRFGIDFEKVATEYFEAAGMEGFTASVEAKILAEKVGVKRVQDVPENIGVLSEVIDALSDSLTEKYQLPSQKPNSF